jgi:pyrroline-5-carboxylate reductase
MSLNIKLAVIGCGNMGGSLAAGFVRSGLLNGSDVILRDEYESSALNLAKQIGDGAAVAKSAAAAAAEADVIVIAVKPRVVESVLTEIAPKLSPKKLVVSIAAGWTLRKLQTLLPNGVPVIRVMPNTPALVGAGASALAAGEKATPEQTAMVRTLLGSIGKAVVIEERLMDAVTGLSGSGPAYVFLIIEALIEGGVREGLSYSDARTLAAQTVLGAAKMALESPIQVSQLRANVTTPGGTTICGVAALEKSGVRYAMMEAVKAASERSREMSS